MQRHDARYRRYSVAGVADWCRNGCRTIGYYSVEFTGGRIRTNRFCWIWCDAGPVTDSNASLPIVAYQTHTNFAEVVPQKRWLLLMLNMRFDNISDPRGACCRRHQSRALGQRQCQAGGGQRPPDSLRDGARATGPRGQAAQWRRGGAKASRTAESPMSTAAGSCAGR